MTFPHLGRSSLRIFCLLLLWPCLAGAAGLVARPGGPYTLPYTGGSITLDGSQSIDYNASIVSYLWDINNDGIYGDRTTATTVLTANDLESIYGSPLSPGEAFDVCLRVTDDSGAVNTACTTVTVIVPEPSVWGLVTLGGLVIVGLRCRPGRRVAGAEAAADLRAGS